MSELGFVLSALQLHDCWHYEQNAWRSVCVCVCVCGDQSLWLDSHMMSCSISPWNWVSWGCLCVSFLCMTVHYSAVCVCVCVCVCEYMPVQTALLCVCVCVCVWSLTGVYESVTLRWCVWNCSVKKETSAGIRETTAWTVPFTGTLTFWKVPRENITRSAKHIQDHGCINIWLFCASIII